MARQLKHKSTQNKNKQKKKQFAKSPNEFEKVHGAW